MFNVFNPSPSGSHFYHIVIPFDFCLVPPFTPLQVAGCLIERDRTLFATHHFSLWEVI